MQSRIPVGRGVPRAGKLREPWSALRKLSESNKTMVQSPLVTAFIQARCSLLQVQPRWLQSVHSTPGCSAYGVVMNAHRAFIWVVLRVRSLSASYPSQQASIADKASLCVDPSRPPSTSKDIPNFRTQRNFCVSSLRVNQH